MSLETWKAEHYLTPATSPEAKADAKKMPPAASESEEKADRSRKLEKMFGSNFERLLDDARSLWGTEKEWRYNQLLRLRESITTTIAASFASPTYAERLATDMIEGKPTIVDKILGFRSIKEADLKSVGAYPSAITRLGYERGDRAVYSHPKRPESSSHRGTCPGKP